MIRLNNDELIINNIEFKKDSKLIITLPIGPYMNYQESGYPFLRYYDLQRQNLIKNKCVYPF